VEIKFEYPISAFAGKNGCGKTTILGLAACAYHNGNIGFKIKSKKRGYYTFSDFFIQTQEELKHDGITISYTFLHNNWSNLERFVFRN
jgi:predicted ATPase